MHANNGDRPICQIGLFTFHDRLGYQLVSSLLFMQTVNISIDWPYFLGIMGGLIGIAWYTGSRFAALETSMDWVNDTLQELKVDFDNNSTPAFVALSPVTLNSVGERWLTESGLKDYIQNTQGALIEKCEVKRGSTPYDVQKRSFRLFDSLASDYVFDQRLKQYAFEHGTTMALLRRVGAIHLRNLCLHELGV